MHCSKERNHLWKTSHGHHLPSAAPGYCLHLLWPFHLIYWFIRFTLPFSSQCVLKAAPASFSFPPFRLYNNPVRWVTLRGRLTGSVSPSQLPKKDKDSALGLLCCKFCCGSPCSHHIIQSWSSCLHSHCLFSQFWPPLHLEQNSLVRRTSPSTFFLAKSRKWPSYWVPLGMSLCGARLQGMALDGRLVGDYFLRAHKL